MKRNINNIRHEREELNRLYNAPGHRRLKYAALTAIAVSIILILSMIIWIDELSPKAMLIMRGCAGLGAEIFVVLVGTSTYRVNKHHIADRINTRSGGGQGKSE